MHLQDLLTESGNTVEVYFCPERLEQQSPILSCGWSYLPRLPTKAFKNRLDQELVEYCHRDITYVYDTSNDAQRVLQRNCLTEKIYDKEYLLVLQEETLPAHRFPCTTEIHAKKTYRKVQYKYNNRIFFQVDKEDNDQYTLYLRYNHAYNVDLEKMNEDWNLIYRQLQKSLYS